ncbi:organic hydroperoxide resistance protein [Sanguibacter hominis ATCC BAA-789]|uniref:Organic hydroperoxide resistance protein n=1 Tax=Sanguibacter hominis ATCC BAA-789 TaxID=1312740 RepID=A0A9X5FCS2_9MICO|nr:organic hydroperoxide resistance protein [Sanguibacter hominis]NKX91889.1 organic hydroperoxide resistance protein [Sanguibacter hominis ATCC BAA-789]
MNVVYTAVATATGDGRNGRTATSDNLVAHDLAVPVEMGGPGGATNPEQLFAAGYAACFHSALKMVARTRKIAIEDSAVTAEVGIGQLDSGGFGLTVALHAEIGGVDQSTADELVAAAHEVCPYSNATRGNVDVTVDATVA